MSVLVAGGGIAGLAAALELGRRGVPVTLVESEPRFGGKIRTESVAGFLVEHGPDSFLTARPAALDLAAELGLGGELVGVREPRSVFVRHRDRLVPMPEGLALVLPTRLRPFAQTPLFSPVEKLRMALDLALPRSAGEGDVAVGPFLRRRLGSAAVDRLAGPLVGGIYGTPIDELSLDAVVPQLRAAEREHRSLLLAGLAQGRAARGTGAARRGGPTGLGMFVSFQDGMERLVTRLEAALRALAPTVDLRTSTRVDGLEGRGSGAVARLSDGTLLRVDAAVLATPAAVTAALLEGLVPGATGPIRAIRHGSVGVVSLGYRRDRVRHPLVGHGVLVAPGDGMAISACTWSSEKWPGRAPDGAVLVRAFVPDAPAAPDGEIGAAVRRDVERLLGASGTPELVRVARFEGSMPRYTVGHLDRIAAMQAALDQRPGIEVVGGAYRGVGIPECVGQARAAATRLAEALLANGPVAAGQSRRGSPLPVV